MKISTLLIIAILSVVSIKAQNFTLTPEMMSLPVNDITFPTTHNSFNASNDGFSLPNTVLNIEQQLALGIRGFEIDIHYQRYGFLWLRSRRKVFHQELTNGSLGYTSVDYQLQQIKIFLDANPNEIIFLKVERSIDSDDMREELEENGLIDYLYQGDGVNLPTLGELIASNKRLIGTNGMGPGLGWGFIYEGTPIGATNVNEITTHEAMFDEPSNVLLWTCNAFILNGVGTGSEEDASIVNDYNWLLDYTEKCWKLNGQKCWRLNVDYPSIGNVVGVANTLNSYKMVRGDVFTDNQLINQVDWECIYNDGDTINTATYGHFNFPLKPGATVKITPKSTQYNFSPSTLEFKHSTFEGENIVINAEPKVISSQLKSVVRENIHSSSDSEKIKVYPMPVNNQFSVVVPKEINEAFIIQLYDLQGRIIKDYGQYNADEHEIKLFAAGIKKGLYFLKVQSGRKRYITKILIE
jgi:hypothetical protein